MMKITLRRDWQSTSSTGVVQDKHVYAQFQWRCHEVFDGLAHQELREAGYKCVAVEAAGDEREWVGRNYTGIPRCNPSMNVASEKWRDNFAAFIYDHLPRVFDKGWGKDPRSLESY